MTKRARTDHGDLWIWSAGLTLFLIVHAVMTAFGSSYVLQDSDTLWHIRVGQWILQNRTFPWTDVFSYTAYGKPWIAVDWLSEVILALTFNIGGWRGVAEITALAIAAISLIICVYLLRVLRFSLAFGAAVIIVVLLSPHYLARPIIFAYAIMAVWLIILLEHYDYSQVAYPRRRPLSLIPLIILWANINGSFTIGLVFLYICSFFFCYEHIRTRQFKVLIKESIFVICVTLGSLATPYGIHSILVTPQVMSMSFTLRHISEWAPPDFGQHKFHLFFFIILVSSFAMFGVRLARIRLSIWLILLYLGLLYARGLVQFVLLAPILLARPFAEQIPYFRSQPSDIVEEDPVLMFIKERVIAIPAIIAVVSTIVLVTGWTLAEPHPSPLIAPQAAMAYIRQAKLRGNVFNSYSFAGYLIFSGVPVAVDGRARPFGDKFIHRYFNAVALVDVIDAFRMLDEYHIAWVFLQPKEPLVSALKQSIAWKEVYSDDFAVIFTRR